MEKGKLEKFRPVVICLVLVVCILAVYWQVIDFEFVNYDDPGYVTKNEYVKKGITGETIVWAFFIDYIANWHPLTWLSHMLDWELFEDWAGGHHLVNVLIHIANTLLLFGILKKMTGALWQSAFVAALFALHPLHVESVAWVSERKDVLSCFFGFLTIAAYIRYAGTGSVKWYVLALVLFAAGLMAKPMLVTLPFVLLLLDYWPLGRIEFGCGDGNVKGSVKTHSTARTAVALVGEKLGLFMLSAVSSIVTYVVQDRGGAVMTPQVARYWFPFKVRLFNTFVSYLKYIEKTFWPTNLAVHYPHPGYSLTVWQVAVAALILVGVTVAVIWFGRRLKYLPVGWFWFLGMLVPVIGLVQLASLAWADRYSYIPLTGLFIIVTWGVGDFVTKQRRRRILAGVLAAVLILALLTATYIQLGYWRNSVSLFKHAVKVTGPNPKMYVLLMLTLSNQGRTEEADFYKEEGERLWPEWKQGDTRANKCLE